jgi:hypothetical protein
MSNDKIIKINSIIQKDLKQKITIKRTMINIKIQNEFNIWLKSEIEKKNKFNKMIKKIIKRMRIKIKIKNTNKFLIERWNWKEKLI